MKWLWFFLVLVLSTVAHADDYPAHREYKALGVVYYDTEQAACQAYFVGMAPNAGSYASYSWWYLNNNWSNSRGYCTNTSGTNYDVLIQRPTCPYGGTTSLQPAPNGYYCVNAPACAAGEVRDATTGECRADCASGTVVSTGYFHMGTDENTAFPTVGCFNGCEATFTGTAPGARQIEASKYHYYAKGTFYQTGEQCASANGPQGASSLPPPSCNLGDIPGQVNGQTVCVNNTTGTPTNPYSPSQSTTTNTDNGDGTTTTTTNGSDGSTTTTTSGGGGSITTTTPGFDGGSSSGTGSTATWGSDGTGDKNSDDETPSFCEQSPNAAMCKEKVPIDEEGTPDTTPEGYLSVQTQKIDDDAQGQLDWFNNREWEVSELPFVWNPPIPGGGSCSKWTVLEREIDICEPLSLARDIWGWVFMVLCGIAIWYRATTVNQGA